MNTKGIRLGHFGKFLSHNFEDCIIKSWNSFTINTSENSHELAIQKNFLIKVLIVENFMKKSI